MNKLEQQSAVGRIIDASQGGIRAIAGLARSRKPEIRTLANRVLAYMESPSATLPEAIDELIKLMEN
jgi:hypothetical protein